MATLKDFKQALAEAMHGATASRPEFICQTAINLYASPERTSLATQAAAGRHLRPVALPEVVEAGQIALEVCLCEDDYPGWLAIADLPHLQRASAPYRPHPLAAEQIQAQLPRVIAFTLAAMAHPNQYLWGGTVGPNYDCSGLVQTAFAAAGIRLPRDAYQQEAFTQPIPLEQLIPGDLIFFGTPERTTHVALYLGEDRYIHSSGKDQGRNGIGIDSLIHPQDAIGLAYQQQIKGAGRVTASYLPKIPPPLSC